MTSLIKFEDLVPDLTALDNLCDYGLAVATISGHIVPDLTALDNLWDLPALTEIAKEQYVSDLTALSNLCDFVGCSRLIPLSRSQT